MLWPRSSLNLLLIHCDEVCAVRPVPNQIEDELHFSHPHLVVDEEYLAPLFQDGFGGSGKGFRSVANWKMFDDKIATRAHRLRRDGDDSIMLEAIVLLLSLATCALIMVAFWGLDMLGRRR